MKRFGLTLAAPGRVYERGWQDGMLTDMPLPMTPRRAGSVVLVAALVTVAGCGAAPPKSGPSGVDGLVIPTPSADPADFRADIDNPWLPLVPGSTWEYDVSGGVAGTRIVTVGTTPLEVGGIETTTVRTVERDAQGEVQVDASEWFAQDRAGNVWKLGEETKERRRTGSLVVTVSWRAGDGGARAGVVMLARPRAGDGYQQELAPGTAEDRSLVLTLDAEITVPSGTYDEALEVEDTSELTPTVETQRYYARGVGLVQESEAGVEAQLVEFTPGS